MAQARLKNESPFQCFVNRLFIFSGGATTTPIKTHSATDKESELFVVVRLQSGLTRWHGQAAWVSLGALRDAQVTINQSTPKCSSPLNQTAPASGVSEIDPGGA